MTDILVPTSEPLPKIVGILCQVIDPESEVPLIFHKLVAYSVDFVVGETKAVFASFFSKAAMEAEKRPVSSVTVTLNSTPMRGIDPDAWILSLVAYPPVENSQSLFNGASPIFEEPSNV